MTFTTSDGLKLDWQEEGAGLPVLCLPGLTRNGSDFDEFAAALGGRYRLIRLTLRGRGKSDRDPDWKNYNVPVEARDVVEFLDFLDLPKATIVGTSRGGMIAMVLAATVRDRISGVLLNDIGPVLEAEGLSNIMDYLGVAPKAKTYPEVVFALEARMGGRFPHLSPGKWMSLAERWFDMGPDGLVLNYDPKLREFARSRGRADAGHVAALRDARRAADRRGAGGEFRPALGRDRRRDGAPSPRSHRRGGARARSCAVPR